MSWQCAKTMGRTISSRSLAPALVAGAPLPGHAHWQTAADGVQHFRLDADGDGAMALALAAPWYLVPATGDLGPLEIDVPAHGLSVLLDADIWRDYVSALVL